MAYHISDYQDRHILEKLNQTESKAVLEEDVAELENIVNEFNMSFLRTYQFLDRATDLSNKIGDKLSEMAGSNKGSESDKQYEQMDELDDKLFEAFGMIDNLRHKINEGKYEVLKRGNGIPDELI